MTEDNITTNVQLENGSPAFAKPVLAAVFFSLIISTLENILKISLIKFANSNKGCIFVSTKTVKQWQLKNLKQLQQTN